MKIIRILIGSVSLLFVLLASILFPTLVIIGGIIEWIIPLRWWRYHLHRITLKIPVLWAGALNLPVLLMSRRKWDIQGDAPLHSSHWYLLVSNHQTWADIPVLQYVFSRKIPIIKFFMKKELLSLPLIGLACWILGYPFMTRHTRADIRKNPALKGKDLETTKKACQRFKEHPTTIMNFIEGTRFTPEKREKQNSPFNHLLKPRAGGLAIVMNELHGTLSGVLDVTLKYSEEEMTFWKLLSGDFEKITVRYRLLPIPDDLAGEYYENREFRKHFQKWLNALWEHKDQQLS